MDVKDNDDGKNFFGRTVILRKMSVAEKLAWELDIEARGRAMLRQQEDNNNEHQKHSGHQG